ncbi:MAG: hypothetical protein ABIH99_04540 [Candidatus Micrarchaeota archaeon]
MVRAKKTVIALMLVLLLAFCWAMSSETEWARSRLSISDLDAFLYYLFWVLAIPLIISTELMLAWVYLLFRKRNVEILLSVLLANLISFLVMWLLQKPVVVPVISALERTLSEFGFALKFISIVDVAYLAVFGTLVMLIEFLVVYYLNKDELELKETIALVVATNVLAYIFCVFILGCIAKAIYQPFGIIMALA